MRTVRLVTVMQRREIALDREPRLAAQHLLGVRLCPGGIADGGERRRAESAVAMVGLGDAAEGLDGLGVAAGDEERAAEVVPEPLGMVRVEAHGLPDPLDTVL